MLFSIIIPTYNSESSLAICLNSIVRQTFKDWQILLLDACSNDDTVRIAKSYNDPRIIIRVEKDRGIYDAMNKGIRLASGQWLYFIGSDDYLYSETVLEEVAKSISTDSEVIYGDVASSGLTECHRGEWTLDNIAYNRCHQAIFYSRHIFKRFGRYNVNYKCCADHDLNLRWFLRIPQKSRYVNMCVAVYNVSGYSSMNTDQKFLYDFVFKSMIYAVSSSSLTISQKYNFALTARYTHYGLLRHLYCCVICGLLRFAKVLFG